MFSEPGLVSTPNQGLRSRDNGGSTPLKALVPFSSLSHCNPTAISCNSTTIIHIVTFGQKGFVGGVAVSGTVSLGSSDECTHGLPQLVLNACIKSSLYLLSPYNSASISGCCDCEIIIGAVAGAVVISGCERVRITVACRKLIVTNCFDCQFNTATLTPTVIAGESRQLIFGPFNASFRDHDKYLQMADLTILRMNEEIESSGPSMNFWSQLCDVNICLENTITAGSPSGYALDAAEASSVILPYPHASTAIVLPTERLQFVTVPCASMHQPPQKCAIPLPEPYQIEFLSLNSRFQELHDRITFPQQIPATSSSLGGGAGGGAGGDIHADRIEPPSAMSISSAVSKKFLEWLVASGRVQHVVDLISLDVDSTLKSSKK